MYLHGGSVGDEVLQLAIGNQLGINVLLLVVRVEHIFHLGPEALLPLEHGLLGDHVGNDAAGQAAREEVVGQVFHVVQRVVVGDHHVGLVLQDAVVAEDRRATILREEGGHEAASADGLPASSVLTSHCVALRTIKIQQSEHGENIANAYQPCIDRQHEVDHDRLTGPKMTHSTLTPTMHTETAMVNNCVVFKWTHLEVHGLVKAQLDTLDMYGISRDRDAVPAPSHGSVGAAPCLLQAPLLGLSGTGSHGGFFEDRTQTLAGGDTVGQHLVVGSVSGLAGEIVELPAGDIHVGLDPLVHAKQLWRQKLRKL